MPGPQSKNLNNNLNNLSILQLREAQETLRNQTAQKLKNYRRDTARPQTAKTRTPSMPHPALCAARNGRRPHTDRPVRKANGLPEEVFPNPLFPKYMSTVHSPLRPIEKEVDGVSKVVSSTRFIKTNNHKNAEFKRTLKKYVNTFIVPSCASMTPLQLNKLDKIMAQLEFYNPNAPQRTNGRPKTR